MYTVNNAHGVLSSSQEDKNRGTIITGKEKTKFSLFAVDNSVWATLRESAKNPKKNETIEQPGANYTGLFPRG